MVIVRAKLENAGYVFEYQGYGLHGNPRWLVTNPDGWYVDFKDITQAEVWAARDFMIRCAAATTRLIEWKNEGFPEDLKFELTEWYNSIEDDINDSE